MILITDGGSTKCDWILIDAKGDVVLKTRTLGLNPAVVPEQELERRIRENSELTAISGKVKQLDFYGAGCGTPIPSKRLKTILEKCFEVAEVAVYEDTIAAVHAATTAPGIVCILGTGSNSCYFDGKKVHSDIPSLGYVLMDEASGNYFGKQLIRDYFYHKMPAALASEFEARFDLDADVIKSNVYREKNPNMYLASFAEFIFNRSENPDINVEENNTYFNTLIRAGIQEFIEVRIRCFKEAEHLPIHFVGSIAHFSKTIIRACLEQQNLTLGSVVRRPIEGLITYYQNHKIKTP